jgi:hypothetical protein
MRAGQPALWAREIGLAVLLAGGSLLLLGFLVRGPLVLKLGPSDHAYVQEFRPEAEREGTTWFHWTGIESRLKLPFRLSGEGFTLRLRVRRHFLEPAHVRLRVEDRVVGAFDLAADPRLAYRVVAFPLGPLSGSAPFHVDIEAPSDNPRPLGIAIDWVEIAQGTPTARISLLPAAHLHALIVVLAAFLGPRAAGARLRWAALHGAAVLATIGWGFATDAVACERTLVLGGSTYGVVALVTVRVCRSPACRRLLGEEVAPVSIVVLAALAIRLAILLHPAFFCPDLLVHSQFTWQLVRRGLPAFLNEYIRHQFQFSLGLQNVNGHWYALPYPPLFYLLAAPLVRVLGTRPEVAVVLLGAAVSSLEAFLVYGLARRLSGSAPLALAASAATPLLPIFVTRLALAYFPAILGSAVDAAALLILVSRYERMDELRSVLVLAVVLAAAFLSYTQSPLNFAVLLGVFLVAECLRDRSPAIRRRALGVVVSMGLAGGIAFSLFYARYLPGLLAMRRGVPQAEEEVLLEKPRSSDVAAPEPEEKNPFFGPDIDVARGLRKAAWRLWVFYGVYAVAVPIGLVLVIRGASPTHAVLVGAWALHYLVMNLGSGGLPSPNLLRYNKEMEFVAPLFCLALAALGGWLWQRSRVVGGLYAAGFLAFGAAEAAHFAGGTLERTL